MARKKKKSPSRKKPREPHPPPLSSEERGEETLEQIDQKIRINELRHRVADLGGTMSEGSGMPPEIEEEFLRQVVDYETAPVSSDFKRLRKEGVVLPPADQMNDKELSKKLVELIERMARRHIFVTSTNHLSDRELYEKLWSDSLREEHPEMPSDAPGGWCIDLISSGSDEDTEVWLKYYADEKRRKDWVKQFPDTKLPPRAKQPYDRDRHLPSLDDLLRRSAEQFEAGDGLPDA